MPAADAMSAVRNHVDDNVAGPAPSVMVAYAVLEAVLVGVKDDPVGKAEAGAKDLESTETTGASADPK